MKFATRREVERCINNEKKENDEGARFEVVWLPMVEGVELAEIAANAHATQKGEDNGRFSTVMVACPYKGKLAAQSKLKVFLDKKAKFTKQLRTEYGKYAYAIQKSFKKDQAKVAHSEKMVTVTCRCCQARIPVGWLKKPVCPVCEGIPAAGQTASWLMCGTDLKYMNPRWTMPWHTTGYGCSHDPKRWTKQNILESLVSDIRILCRSEEEFSALSCIQTGGFSLYGPQAVDTTELSAAFTELHKLAIEAVHEVARACVGRSQPPEGERAGGYVVVRYATSDHA